MKTSGTTKLTYAVAIAGILAGILVHDKKVTALIWVVTFEIVVNLKYLSRAIFVKNHPMTATVQQLAASVWHRFQQQGTVNIMLQPDYSANELMAAIERIAPREWRRQLEMARVPLLYTIGAKVVLPRFKVLQFGRAGLIRKIDGILHYLDFAVLLTVVTQTIPTGPGYDFWLRLSWSSTVQFTGVAIAVIAGFRVLLGIFGEPRGAVAFTSQYFWDIGVAPFLEETVHGWAYMVLFMLLLSSRGVPGVLPQMFVAACLTGLLFSLRHPKIKWLDGMAYFGIHFVLTTVRSFVGVPAAIIAHTTYNLVDAGMSWFGR